MKILWLTLADPEPATNGQFLYSQGLIRAIAVEPSVEVHVTGLKRDDAGVPRRRQDDGIFWHLVAGPHRSKWAALVSRLPQLAKRSMTESMQAELDRLLREERWDSIVFDSISVGWALYSILRTSGPTPPKIVYLSHNHEESLARKIAGEERNPLKRVVRTFEAWKVRRLERALVRYASLITSNSPADCKKFRHEARRKRVDFLPPGYAGRRVACRAITSATPRRALIVGSFDWVAKRTNLENFLAESDDLFAQAGIELVVVGSAEPSYISRVRASARAANMIGPVDDLAPYFDEARLALIVDRFGGFKLKTLDYIFNRVPILGVAGSVPGVPLRRGQGILLFDDHRALARGVLGMIDDIDALNRIQENAYRACDRHFDWDKVGARLRRALSDLQYVDRRSSSRNAIAGGLGFH